MAGSYDTEQQRMIDRIKCIAFRDAGATFINRQWISDKVHRSIRFVADWWEKSHDQCFADYSNVGAKLKLSEARQVIIRKASGRQKKAVRLWRRRLQRSKTNMSLEEQLIIIVTEKD